MSVNILLIAHQPLLGCTPLHLACLLENKSLVKLLIEDYDADVNVYSRNGAQPIHLACFQENAEIANILLKSGANVDAEINRGLFSKYAETLPWCYNFGDKITVLTFAILYQKSDSLVKVLVENRANLRVQCMKNKTLLMYAFERDLFDFGFIIIDAIKDRKFLNAVDENGYTVTDYLLHPKKFQSYNAQEFMEVEAKMGKVLHDLISRGADVCETSNDSGTELLNMAVCRSSTSMLRTLFAHDDYRTKSNVLLHALRLPEHPRTLFGRTLSPTEQRWLQNQREECIKLILKDLINRSAFGLPVPEGDKEFMERLITNIARFRTLVEGYEANFINEELKRNVIEYDDTRITYYDFILMAFDDKKLHSLVKNKALVAAFQKYFPADDNYSYFKEKILIRIGRVARKYQLLNELQCVKPLREAIPLPYELILDIVDHCSTHDLAALIDAFEL